MQRKRYTLEFKQQIVKEVHEVGSGTLVARKYDINENMVNRWARETASNGSSRTAPSMPQDHKQLMAENEQLKKLIRKKELENEILRDLLKKTNPHLKIK